MADPLSISASVAGLVSLAMAVTQSCYGVYREIRNAPRMLKDVIDELNLLRQVLVDLKDICDQSHEPLQPLDKIVKDLQQCETRLGEFDKQLASKFRNPRGILSRFRWSFENSEIRSFINQLQTYRELFDSAKTNATLQLAMAIRKDVSSTLLLDDIARKEKNLKSILDWLSPLDFSEYQNDFYEVRREPRTSEWIEREKSFVEWRDRDVPYAKDYKRTLWCYGPPGSGKTITCSVLINSLLQLPGNTGVAYMYCSSYHQGMQTADILIGALTRQLVVRKASQGELPKVVQELYDKIGANNKPNLKSLVQLLRDVTALFDQAYIVVDGIDEVESGLYWKLLRSALDMIPENKTKFLISSRSHDYSIVKYLQYGFKICVNAPEADICNYLTSQISRDENFGLIAGDDPLLVKNIVSEISQQCEGLFALAHLHLQRVAEQTNKAAVIEQLKQPACNLQSEYGRGLARMKQLSPPRYQLALRTMNYMAQSKVLFTPEELQDALSVEVNSFGPSKDRRPPIAMIVGVCLGFVFENPISSRMEFFHTTVAEYLSTSSSMNDLELDLGGCCVLYLMSTDLARRCVTERQAEERRSQYLFAAYASRFWGDKIRGQPELKHEEILLRFLTSDNRISSLQLLPPDTAYDEDLIGKQAEWFDVTTDANSFAVYTCAYLRLKEIMPSLLAKGFDPGYTAPLGLHSSPLHLGVKALDLKICELLIKAGVNVNIQDKMGKTPLHLAWELSGDNVSQIRTLLEDAGGRFDITDSQGRNVLQNALQFGNTSILGHVIDGIGEPGLQNQDSDGNTALHVAVTRRYYLDVKHLLAKNANPLIRNNKGQRPLDLATEGKDYSSRLIATHILEYVDEKSIDYPRQQPVTTTISEDLEGTSISLEEMADRTPPPLQRRNRDSKDAMLMKLREGYITAAEQEDAYTLSGYLLNGANVNFVHENSGMTPLHHAILSNHELPIWHLLAAGADIDLKDKRHGLSASELAQKSEHPSVAALFHHDNNEPGDSFGPSLMWQSMYHQVGRGMWSKRISGNELRAAYRNAAQLREQMAGSSVWNRPGLEIWYDYLGYKEPEDERSFFNRRKRSP